jgi:protein-tyrosine phosphatase
MDKSNYANIIRLAQNEKDKNKVKMVLNEIMPGMNSDLPDPYYGGVQGFENVFSMLDEATDIIVNKRLK